MRSSHVKPLRHRAATLMLSCSAFWMGALWFGAVWVGAVWSHGARAAEATGMHDRYRWRDAQGNLFYSDDIPPAALVFGYDVIGPQGIVKKHVDRAMTAEEKAKAAADKKQEQEAKALVEEKARQDRQLLTSYPEESDLVRAHDATLKQLDQQIEAFQSNLSSQERSLSDALGNAADNETSERKVTQSQRDTVYTLQARITEQRKIGDKLQAERAGMVEKFDAETQRYRALKAQQAAERAGS